MLHLLATESLLVWGFLEQAVDVLARRDIASLLAETCVLLEPANRGHEEKQYLCAQAQCSGP